MIANPFSHQNLSRIDVVNFDMSMEDNKYNKHRTMWLAFVAVQTSPELAEETRHEKHDARVTDCKCLRNNDFSFGSQAMQC